MVFIDVQGGHEFMEHYMNFKRCGFMTMLYERERHCVPIKNQEVAKTIVCLIWIVAEFFFTIG